MNESNSYENELGKLTYKGYQTKIDNDVRDYIIYSNKFIGREGYFTKVIDEENDAVICQYTWKTVEETRENHLRIAYEMENFKWLKEE